MSQILDHRSFHCQSSHLTDRRSVVACCEPDLLSCSLHGRGFIIGDGVLWWPAKSSPYPIFYCRLVEEAGNAIFCCFPLSHCYGITPSYPSSVTGLLFFSGIRTCPLSKKLLLYGVHWLFLALPFHAQYSPCFGLSNSRHLRNIQATLVDCFSNVAAVSVVCLLVGEKVAAQVDCHCTIVHGVSQGQDTQID